MLTRPGSKPDPAWMRAFNDRSADMHERRRTIPFALFFVLYMAFILVVIHLATAVVFSGERSYSSSTQIAGLPIVSYGASAKGIIAIGARATGVIAIGGLAIGVVAIGGLDGWRCRARRRVPCTSCPWCLSGRLAGARRFSHRRCRARRSTPSVNMLTPAMVWLTAPPRPADARKNSSSDGSFLVFTGPFRSRLAQTGHRAASRR